MADTEVQNDINEIIIDYDGSESETKALNSNNIIIQQSILSDDGPQSIINISNSNDDVISETILSDDGPQSIRLYSKADPEIQNNIIFKMIGDGSESDTNISNSNDNIISESILIDDGTQSITNILNSNEYIISETILSDDRPHSVINILNSENDVISKTILNVDGPENVINILNSNDNDIFETIRNDDRAQSVTNIHNDDRPKIVTNVLNTDDDVISETIHSDDRPTNLANILNTYDDIISETILSDDRPQSVANHLNLNDDVIYENILNDDRLKNATGILNTNDDVISETILSDDRPQSVTIIINSNDNNIISETVLNDDRPQSVTNILNSNDAVSETNLNSDRPTNITNILHTNNDHTEISNLNTNESENILSSHFNEDPLNKTEVDVLPLSNQSSICEPYENYKIGDIVWAKIGKYPFWPGIICSDPKSSIYFRNNKKIWFHVRFCNDKGRRSWIRTLISYCGKNELLSKYPNCLSSLKNSRKLMNTWNLAVEEADQLLKLDREIRLEEFFKTFSNLDDLGSVTSSSLNNCSDGTDSTIKVRTYTRKRSLTVPEQDSKKIKTENISVNGSSSSRSIDIPLLSRSDDADSTVSDISMSYAYTDNIGLKGKEDIVNKRKSTKTYPPKNSFTHNYDLSDSMETSPEYNGDNILLSDNHTKFTDSNMSSTHSVPGIRKRKISSKCEKEICSVNNDKNNIITLLSLSLSNSKKTVTKNKRHRKESSTGRKSVTTKSESSPEPDTTESEASSKNETYSTVFLASTKNKQLFVKTMKRACVVCKSIENTVKCFGPCQSYFHIECLAKSEERYHKSETKIEIKNKKSGRRKRNYKDQLLNFKSKSIKNPTPDDFCDLSEDKNSILTVNEDTERLSELKIANNDSVREISEEKVIDTPLKSLINGKSSKDDLKYMCSSCKADKTNCFVCGLVIEDDGEKIMCKMNSCGKYYHEKCLRDWPQCQWFQGLRNNIRCVVCPHHVCHLCISDNPKSSCKTHFPGEKLTRCIKCPTAYHRSEYCLPAGSKVLTYFDIICSRHFEPSKLQNHHFNAPWCFICTLGGTLICCDLCPSSFHIECLNQNPSEFEEGFTCEECQTGRYPLYGEIVWVKIGQYRWWPAQVVFPNQVPDSVNAIPHSVGQFAVRFFGSYDYYWVNRGRVFNFHEGDDENILKKSKMKVIDQVFQNAIVEAAQAHNAYVLDKDKNDAIVAKKSVTKPPKFMRIKFNRPIGNVKNIEFDNTTMTPCECDPFKPNPCGPGSDCINRMLMFECHPQLCPAGDKCNNQRFEKTLYPAMVPFLTKGRGWGLKTLEDIKEGSFIIEYVGDVIDEEEYQRRCLEMHQRNEQNYYFLTIDNSRMIDAGPKGNLSRFMNHSCEPNCVTQKWTVNGDTRIGLFALHDIPSDTELVFDYRLQSCSGVEKKPCQCGAARCSKFIGVKVEEEKKKLVSINDADKCKTATKNKRKPLKLKDNVSDSDKSKLSKVSKNEQNVSVTENKVYISNVEKTYDSKKAKTKVTNGRKSTTSKNENLETSKKLAVKKKWKNTKNSTKTTKDDNISNSLDSKETGKRGSTGKILSTLPLRKKNVFKTDLLPLSYNNTELSTPSTLCMSEAKGQVGHLKNIKDMKTKRIPVDCTNDLMKTQQTHEVIKNANVNISSNSTTIFERSRNSLSRLAKSRHLFLSKINTNKEKNENPVVLKKIINTVNKNTTTKLSKKNNKPKEITSIKTTVLKKTKMNKLISQPNSFYKNDSCLICGKGHTELTCKNKKCPRVFHLSCMNKTRIVKSGFICPSHFCSVCKKRKVVAKCKLCVESFCTTHVKGNIFKDPLGNGMLCTTHYSDKKSLPIASSSSVNSKLFVTNSNTESVDFSGLNLGTAPAEDLPDYDEDQLNIDEMNEDEYNLTQVVKDECNREYIHIGGFNVCNTSDLVADQEESYTAPANTDGDLFKPSSANVVIDIESASALYQPTHCLELESIATENKDSHGYANVHFIPDTSQTKNKWLAAEP